LLQGGCVRGKIVPMGGWLEEKFVMFGWLVSHLMFSCAWLYY